ncbi:DUF2806 domain-containing protein [Mesorhizobium sp. M1252]|uniref:DUF2806 domain-containing protein n=1 Tax=Mesorhizobium sp. M1252 TaxID=2957073 RepID=UPI00333B7339
MKKDDHLDKETSVSAELTPTGVKASAKSRFVAAVDRLGGNLVELMNAPIEAKVAERRAVSDSRVLAIETVAALGLERLKTDPDFAERAIRSHLDSMFAGQENKDAVLAKAVEDLRNQPPTEGEATSGSETLDEAFVRRFDRFAEAATTEELREKWGRVLAQEIRTPNTFSAKVLRIVDELDPQTAKLFETLCEHRLDNVVPKILSKELDFAEVAKLTGADLLVEPGLGQRRLSFETQDSDGKDLWMWPFGREWAITVSRTSEPIGVFGDATKTVLIENNMPTVPVYVLSAEGVAVASILPDNTATALDRLATEISVVLSKLDVRTYGLSPDGQSMSPIRTIIARSEESPS